MKRIFSIAVMLLISLQICTADSIKRISVTFDKNDFTLSKNAMGLLEVISNKQLASYGEDLSEPGLPLIPVNVLIPKGASFSGLTVTTSKSLVQENVVVAANPRALPTMEPIQDEDVDFPQYASKVYPSVSGEYKCTTCIEGCTMLNFLVSPFVYDAASKRLYLNENITLSISLKNSNGQVATFSNNREEVSDIVKSLVINSEDLNVNSTTTTTKSIAINDTTEKVEYLIVTSSWLAPYFQQIAQWKRTKGIPSEVISVEEIKAKYEGETIPLKIKKCLYDLYKNKGLKYVLLGGDDTVVPVERCYVTANDSVENEMPTDLFYACFGGSFNWDGNNNNIFGETDDNIDMSPSIYVTRLPICAPADVDSYSTKLLAYERIPLKGNWNNNILMAGRVLWGMVSSSKSDAEAKGDNLYNNYIKPYWTGTRKKFYDTYTDFDGGANYALSAANLQEQLSNGYNFLDMITHGSPEKWSLEDDRYHDYEAKELNNNGFTIITTSACQTNQFDYSKKDPCLSEAFIRNANNGVVAYLGSSRYGWGTRGSSLGVSELYNAYFYKNLFSSSIENKNFGVIVAATKARMISSSRYNNGFRWIQFGLNPIGDPEMPIFTTTPRQFSDVSIDSENGVVKVNTGVDGCNICIMSINDNGASFYKVQKNVREATFTNINGTASLCITKQNYIPFVKQVDYNISIQDETIITDKDYDADTIKVGSAVTTSKAQGPVNLNNGKINLKAKKITIEPKVTISKNVKLTLSNK